MYFIISTYLSGHKPLFEKYLLIETFKCLFLFAQSRRKLCYFRWRLCLFRIIKIFPFLCGLYAIIIYEWNIMLIIKSKISLQETHNSSMFKGPWILNTSFNNKSMLCFYNTKITFCITLFTGVSLLKE